MEGDRYCLILLPLKSKLLVNFNARQDFSLKNIVYKLRIKNSDLQKGKSGGYRLIYWLQTPKGIVLLDIYSKSEKDNVDVKTIQQIIANFERDR